jgi:hypothetical protein
MLESPDCIYQAETYLYPLWANKPVNFTKIISAFSDLALNDAQRRGKSAYVVALLDDTTPLYMVKDRDLETQEQITSSYVENLQMHGFNETRTLSQLDSFCPEKFLRFLNGLKLVDYLGRIMPRYKVDDQHTSMAELLLLYNNTRMIEAGLQVYGASTLLAGPSARQYFHWLTSSKGYGLRGVRTLHLSAKV